MQFGPYRQPLMGIGFSLWDWAFSHFIEGQRWSKMVINGRVNVTKM